MLNKLIMLIGLPGSGKSEFAKRFIGNTSFVVHSSDELRKELFGSYDVQDRNGELFIELHKRIKNDLLLGKDVVYDACNISYKRRKAFLEEIKKTDCIKSCVLFLTPYEICLEQNFWRNKKVPEHIIKKMYLNFNVPQYWEGFDDIDISTNYLEEYKDGELFKRLDLIGQNNPHHKWTIGIHCKSCSVHIANMMIEKNKSDVALIGAALYHDIGKEFTKEFKNSRGEPTEFAHYYNHHNVSAYLSLFYTYKLGKLNEALEIANLIQWHMQPFFMKTEKSKQKFLSLVGQETFDKIMLLHRADILAH
jgi:predicted kinase